jgi:hypothetical protein
MRYDSAVLMRCAGYNNLDADAGASLHGFGCRVLGSDPVAPAETTFGSLACYLSGAACANLVQGSTSA